MKKISRFLSLISIIGMSFFVPFQVHAEKPIYNPVLNPLFGDNIGEEGGNAPVFVARLLARFFAAALAAGTIFFLGYFVFGAFKWITAGGDTKQVADARGAITQAIIGLAILASVFAIANLISPLLGLSSANCNFPRQICWPVAPVQNP